MELSNADGHMIVSRPPTFNSVADLNGKSHEEIYREYYGEIQYRLLIENAYNQVILNNNANIDRLEQALTEKNLLISSLSHIDLLKKDNERLTEENNKLNKEVARLTEENNELNENIDNLAIEFDTYKLSNDSRYNDFKDLIYNGVLPEIAKLKEKNTELNRDMNFYKVKALSSSK